MHLLSSLITRPQEHSLNSCTLLQKRVLIPSHPCSQLYQTFSGSCTLNYEELMRNAGSIHSNSINLTQQESSPITGSPAALEYSLTPSRPNILLPVLSLSLPHLSEAECRWRTQFSRVSLLTDVAMLSQNVS